MKFKAHKFKAHNCRVIDTGKAMVSDGNGGLKLRIGGMPQKTVHRKLNTYTLKRRVFVKT